MEPRQGEVTLILYQSADQRTFTLTLLARKKKRLLQGHGDQGEVKVSLKPAKTKHAKRKRKKKTKLSLAKAKQITAGFEGVTLAPPPRTANDVLLLFDKSFPSDRDCSNRLPPTEEEVRDLGGGVYVSGGWGLIEKTSA